jgi:hypothetical protein
MPASFSPAAFYSTLHGQLAELEQPEWRNRADAAASMRHFIALLHEWLSGLPVPSGIKKAEAYADCIAGMTDERFTPYRECVRTALDEGSAFIDALRRYDPLRTHFYTVCAEWVE